MIVYSKDYGHTWQRARNELTMSLYGVAVNGMGWAIGEKGTVLFSKDGGQSWKPWPKAQPSFVWIGSLSVDKTGKKGFAAGSFGNYQILSE